MKAWLLKGWGYWDTTHYPYGGCFRRAAEDTNIEVIEGHTGPRGEYHIRFPDGRVGYADKRAVMLLSEAQELLAQLES